LVEHLLSKKYDRISIHDVRVRHGHADEACDDHTDEACDAFIQPKHAMRIQPEHVMPIQPKHVMLPYNRSM
jgi:hypothetical protein